MDTVIFFLVVGGWTLAGFFSGICVGIFFEREHKE